MNYGYARVSSRSQNLDRQMEELKAFGLTESQLYIDQQSGKDFDRQAYRQLKEVLRPQDLLVIKSIDPVSYTHLDVYKRQVPRHGPGRPFDRIP